MPGFLAVLLGKVAGLGAVKAALATVAATLTLALAGGAAALLSVPGGDADSGVVAQVLQADTTGVVAPATSSAAPVPPAEIGVQAGTEASVESLSASSQAAIEVATPTVATPVNVPSVPSVALPPLPSLPVIPPCVANLLPTAGSIPDPAALVAKLPACILSVVTANLPIATIQSVIGSANLPVNIAGCLSSVLGSVPAVVGGTLSGLPALLAACLPTGAIPGVGSIPGLGSIPGMGSIPFIGSIPFMDSIPFTGSIPGFGAAR